MKIVIEGINRTEFCRPDKKDIDRRRFYETRGQLYRAYPEQMIRARISEFGKEIGTEDVIFYQENSIHPMVARGTMVDKEKLLADIDENKIMTSGVFVNKKSWGTLTSGTSRLFGYIPLIIVGVVLVYAVLMNGGM